MAGTLKFKVTDDLKAIIKHAAENDPGEYYGTKIVRSVKLVKDQGVYLMSAGQPGLYPESPIEGRTITSQLVCYAAGLDPVADEFDDWYDKARSICGGDDSSEPLPVATFEEIIASGATEIIIKMTAKNLTISSR